jgi:hypothetical protein
VEPAAELNIDLRQVSLARNAERHLWEVGWEVENRGGGALKILAARLPHGQFRSAEQFFRPQLELPAGGQQRFQSAVHCDEPPGLVTENAFVILHCEWRGEAWRIFVRMRIVVKANGEPESATESITTQKVGFSGIAN